MFHFFIRVLSSSFTWYGLRKNGDLSVTSISTSILGHAPVSSLKLNASLYLYSMSIPSLFSFSGRHDLSKNMTLRSSFLHNRINFILKHKLLPCHQQRLLQVNWKMFTYTTDGSVVENFLLYNIMCFIQFVLFLFYSFLWCYYALDVMCYIYFILFHFILFVQLYPDVMGHYVLGLYGVFNLLCFGRRNSHYLFYFILFYLFNYTMMLWVIMV